METPPLASSNIFNIDLGPNVVRMISATACKTNENATKWYELEK